MKKWIRRLLVAGATLLIVAVVTLFIGWRMVRGTPQWYQPDSLSAEQRDAAAQSAIRKLSELQNDAALARALEQAAKRGTTRPSTNPAEITITFTDDELNSLLASWSVWQSVRSSYEKFITEPYIVLLDGKLILAGRLIDIDSIASVHFAPSIDADGKLRLQLAQVLAGTLPLPSSLAAKYQRRAIDGLNRRLPYWGATARIDPTGIANDSAVCALMADLLTHVLNDESAEPVIFTEILTKGRMPVRLTSVEIADHAITLKVIPMTPQEREALLGSIQSGRPVLSDNR